MFVCWFWWFAFQGAVACPFSITLLCLLSNRVRSLPPLSFEETERRVLLMKKWSAYKQSQDRAEKQAIRSLVEAQQEALKELRLESEELYQAAIRRDEGLFPFERDGPNYTPPLPGYDPPEGKCIDITKVYTQWQKSLLFIQHKLLSQLKKERTEWELIPSAH